MSKVYVYKEYFDEDVYGEEFIKVFAKAKDAISFLKARFIEAYKDYGNTVEEIVETGNDLEEGFLDSDDTVEIGENGAYISIGNGDGAATYWIVEEHEVE